MVTIREALIKAVEVIGEREFINPVLDSQLLMAYTLDSDKNYIYTHMNSIVEDEKLDQFYRYVEKRSEGYPLQYILKNQEFMGLEFKVDEGVLVPRPDTEILVEKIIDICKKRYENKDRIRILEIGTGSGAIAISLAHFIEKATVYAVDIDEDNCKLALENAKMHGVEDRVFFLTGDLFKPVNQLDKSTFDIIVSNPPYIRTDEIENLQIEVSTYEPKLALDGGSDGLQFYRDITRESIEYIGENGVLAYEIGHDQASPVKDIMSEHYKNIQVIEDYGKNDRVIIGDRKS